MRHFLTHIAIGLVHFGAFGLLILGVLDSSFLFMPLGNDLLVIALSARNHSHMPYYAAMAAAGSVLGCLLIDIVFRKGGEETLEKHVPKKQFQYLKRKIEKRAGWAIVFASLMPPPFPFTPVVAGAAAFEYPRKHLLSLIGVSRLVRFSVEGTLAIVFGRRILAFAKSPVLEWGVIAVIVISVIGSAASIYKWVRNFRRKTAKAA